MPDAYDFDFFVIGAGSGGTRAARIAAGHGARVGVAEERYLGGTCVNVGCVPKKLMVYASHFSHAFEDAAGFGWTVEPKGHDWTRFITAKNEEIARLNGIYRRLITNAGATLFDDRATLVDAHTVEVGGARYSVDKVLIATGGWPVLPTEPGAQEFGITSNEVFYLDERPERLVVVGGGYIAVEFAGVFAGLGTQVAQLYRGDLFLRGFDSDVRGFLAQEMRKSGIDLRFKTTITKIEKSDGGLAVHLSDGTVIEADQVLYAIGRRPMTGGLGLEAAGVETNTAGAIVVDDRYRTSADGVYALGDVTNRVNLTPVAIAEGHWLADTLFGPGRRAVTYDNIPTAVFSTPPIGTVGLSEDEARRAYPKIDVYKADFRAMKHTLSGRDTRTLMKLVVERETQRVLGAHMVGEDAGEIVQGLGIAMTAGATKQHFDQTIGIHPTTAEEFVTMRTPEPDPEPAQAMGASTAEAPAA